MNRPDSSLDLLLGVCMCIGVCLVAVILALAATGVMLAVAAFILWVVRMAWFLVTVLWEMWGMWPW